MHGMNLLSLAATGQASLPQLWGLGVLPFLALLGAIALLPLLPHTHHWWESNLNRLKVSLLCGGATLIYILWAFGLHHVGYTLEHAVLGDYVPFIMVLLSLYVISGGIALTGDLRATPLTNATFMAIGAAIASFVGTTGASMLLIRPLLQTNRERRHVAHTVVFFIFLVSNIGGTLLPIGDPPLLLGYFYGVPFFWTLVLWKEWAVACAILLVMYLVIDTIMFKRERATDVRRDIALREPLRVQGSINFLWLGLAVVCVALVNPAQPLPVIGWTPFVFFREIVLAALIGLSLLTTPHGIRARNRFTYTAILEVAALFIGIFVAMSVPLEVLKAIGPQIVAQGIDKPWHFFWLTGSLSSVLDNAPTYLVFLKLSETVPPGAGVPTIGPIDKGAYVPEDLLIAVSLGSVFMGAMTYIGNGPNFMVKSIAEQAGVRMPSFFGYVFKYSIPALVPVFVLITLLFLR